MLERVPQLAQKGVCQFCPDLGVAGQVRDELDDRLHDHGLVVGLLLALDFGLDHLGERLVICKKQQHKTKTCQLSSSSPIPCAVDTYRQAASS